MSLSTPKWGEAAVFVEGDGLGQGWDKLPTLRVPTGFVMAQDPIATKGPEMTAEMVWRPPVSANEIVIGSGHLVRLKPRQLSHADTRSFRKNPTRSQTRYVGSLVISCYRAQSRQSCEKIWEPH